MKRVDDLALPRLVDDAGAGQARQQRQRQVLAHRHVGDDALDLAVLGAEADAGAIASAGSREVDRRCRRSGSSPPSRPVGAEDGARRLGAAGAEQPGQPDDLAGAHREADVAHPTADCEMLGLEQLAADACAWLVEARWRPGAAPCARSRPSMAATSSSLVMSRHRPRRRPCGRRA